MQFGVCLEPVDGLTSRGNDRHLFVNRRQRFKFCSNNMRGERSNKLIKENKICEYNNI